MDARSTDSKLVSLLAMILALMLCNLGISAFVCAINRDIDLFVRETAKLFGHLGTPEYAHGACSFRIFLVCKAEESTGEEKAYYESVQKVILERQIGSHYYCSSYTSLELSTSTHRLVDLYNNSQLENCLHA